MRKKTHKKKKPKESHFCPCQCSSPPVRRKPRPSPAYVPRVQPQFYIPFQQPTMPFPVPQFTEETLKRTIAEGLKNFHDKSPEETFLQATTPIKKENGSQTGWETPIIPHPSVGEEFLYPDVEQELARPTQTPRPTTAADMERATAQSPETPATAQPPTSPDLPRVNRTFFATAQGIATRDWQRAVAVAVVELYGLTKYEDLTTTQKEAAKERADQGFGKKSS